MKAVTKAAQINKCIIPKAIPLLRALKIVVKKLIEATIEEAPTK